MRKKAVTTIQLTPKVKEALRGMKRDGETYEKVIRRRFRI